MSVIWFFVFRFVVIVRPIFIMQLTRLIQTHTKKQQHEERTCWHLFDDDDFHNGWTMANMWCCQLFSLQRLIFDRLYLFFGRCFECLQRNFYAIRKFDRYSLSITQMQCYTLHSL